jgi:DNA-binding GntR family transcriptional regulator
MRRKDVSLTDLKRIKPFSPYKEKIYEQLKEAIMNHTFRPGDPLMERTIAEQLGVSRTPVREALKLLEHEGWVETLPWKGVFVTCISPKEAKELLQLRIANERFVMELIAEQITDEELAVLDEKMKELQKRREEKNHQKLIAADRGFHYFLAELCGNSRLVNLLKNLSDHIERVGLQALYLSDRPLEAYQEHSEIVEALKARDKEQAVKAMDVHLNNTLQAVLQSITDEGKGNK